MLLNLSEKLLYAVKTGQAFGDILKTIESFNFIELTKILNTDQAKKNILD